MNSLEIKNAISDMVKECRSIVATCKTEVREMSEDEKNRFEELKSAIEDKKSELDKLQRELDEIEIPSEENEKKEEERKEDVQEKEEEKNNEERNMKKTFSLVEELRNAVRTGNKVEIPVENRAVTVAGVHDDVIETDFWDILAPLRDENVLVSAGAKFVPGLVGDVQIPVMNPIENAFWAGETDTATESSATFTNVKLLPKRLTAFMEISLQLLEQDSLGVEAMIRKDLVDALNGKIESTLLGAGAGDSNTPAGLFNGRDEQVADTYAKLCGVEADLEKAHVKDFKYIVSPKAKAAFRSMAKSTKNTQLVMEGGSIDGTPTLSTGYVADNKFLVGDFSNLVIGQWGNIQLEVVRDSASLKKGCVTIVVNTFFDAKVPEARKGAIVAGTVVGA